MGQQQQPMQGLPSLCPPVEDVYQPAAAAQAQQAGPSAELVDGYRLHITGDAIDALQSPVCASAQVHYLLFASLSQKGAIGVLMTLDLAA